MWSYNVQYGTVTHDENFEGVGYSGNGDGLNNPAMEDKMDIGPIPRGLYRIEGFFDDLEKGPVVTHLDPDPSNEMYGRSGFMIHGDNQSMNHSASDGCIILDRDIREAIRDSEDMELTVI